jgi:hypothetical protein
MQHSYFESPARCDLNSVDTGDFSPGLRSNARAVKSFVPLAGAKACLPRGLLRPFVAAIPQTKKLIF